MGGPDDDHGGEVALDGAGNVHALGIYGLGANDVDPGQGTLNLFPPGGSGGTFLVKLDPNRNLIWGRGTPVSFVIVATIFLGLCFVGWRMAARALLRRRRQSSNSTATAGTS